MSYTPQERDHLTREREAQRADEHFGRDSVERSIAGSSRVRREARSDGYPLQAPESTSAGPLIWLLTGGILLQSGWWRNLHNAGNLGDIALTVAAALFLTSHAFRKFACVCMAIFVFLFLCLLHFGKAVVPASSMPAATTRNN